MSDLEKEVMRRIIEEDKDFSEEEDTGEEEDEEKEPVEKRKRGPKPKPLPDEVMKKLQGTNHLPCIKFLKYNARLFQITRHTKA